MYARPTHWFQMVLHHFSNTNLFCKPLSYRSLSAVWPDDNVYFDTFNFYLTIYLYLFRRVKELRWLAEATYTGEALDFSKINLIKPPGSNAINPVVIVLTDGRSDILRDRTPLTVLCNEGIRVRQHQKCHYDLSMFLICRICIIETL